MANAPVSISLLESIFSTCERKGVPYGLGSKIDLSIQPDQLEPGTHCDCSGFIRWVLKWASGGAFVLPDGSQMQREWCENAGLHKLAHYSDANTYGTPGRLFIHFIKPYTNGCGATGHVWLSIKFNDDTVADTIECYGGHGVGSRVWNARPLRTEVYESFELLVKP